MLRAVGSVLAAATVAVAQTCPAGTEGAQCTHHVDVEEVRRELNLKPVNAADTSTPKTLIVGNVWEQMGEGTRSLANAISLAGILGRQYVLPYIQNTETTIKSTTLFKGNKIEAWGENYAFETVFDVDEFRKCYPGQTIIESMEAATLNDDMIGVYFIYPNGRDRVYNAALEAQSGIFDCTEQSKELGLLDLGKKEHLNYTFHNVPQLNKILCVDNDLRERYTTRGFFEEVLGGYNTIYLLNWRGIRSASHRNRFPDAEKVDPWGPWQNQRKCIFGGPHVFNEALNQRVDDYVANVMKVPKGGTFLLVHLRMEKVQVAPGMLDETFIHKFVESVTNIRKHFSLANGLPEGQLVPVYLASDALTSRSFARGKLDRFHGFAKKFEAALGTHTFDCVANGLVQDSIECSALELLMMSRCGHLVQLGASSFTRWGSTMMKNPSVTRMVSNGREKPICVYQSKASKMNNNSATRRIMFGQVYKDLVAPVQFCP